MSHTVNSVENSNVEDDIGRVDAAGEGFGAGRLDGGQARRSTPRQGF
jgi:hypothetical protein